MEQLCFNVFVQKQRCSLTNCGKVLQVHRITWSTVKVRTFTAGSFESGAGLVAHTLEHGCVSQSARAATTLG
jgi:hypothetical protein